MWGYVIFQNFWEMGKDIWYHKTFEKCRVIRKMKIQMWTVWLFTCSRVLKNLKNLILQKVVNNRDNELKCGDYSLLFSMCTDDDEQHFN